MVGREKEMVLVRAWLTGVEGFRRPTVKVLVIGGMTGVGKTVLARAIGEDPLIKTYFRDGVLWAQLGQQPHPRSWMEEWASLLGWTRWSAESAERYLARFLADEERRVLLILDDVWPDTLFDPLISLAGPQCRVLITSRALTVAGVYERSRLLHLELPNREEAVAMARSMLDGQPGGAEPAEVDRILVELVEAVDRLPIAIFAAGLLEETGEQNTKGRWTQRLTVALVGRLRWWRATVPSVWIGPRRFTRAWWVQGWEDFLAMQQHFIDLLRKRWREKGLTAEMWAVGTVINRRIERLMRRSWGIVIGLAVLALTSGMILWAWNHGQFDWAAWPRWTFVVVDGVFYSSLLAFMFACWAITFAIVDFYRLYHMPIGVLKGKEATDSTESANEVREIGPEIK